MRSRLVATTVTISALILAVGGVASADPGGGGGAGTAASSRAAADKLDTGLQALAAAAAQGKPVSSSTAIASTGSVKLTGMDRVENGKVLVNVYVNGSVAGAADQLRGLGMDVTGTSNSEPERVVAGWVPASALTQVAALTQTRAVLASHGMTDAALGSGGTDTGSVLSQGDAALHGPQARALGTNGAGVKVGVISDSINVGTNGSNGIATSVGTGDLPAGTSTLADDPGGADEGRAMAEIIYDEAPGVSQMVFSTGTISAAGKATSINNLVGAGVKVIADDIFYPDEPMFQDGIVSQAVDAAKAAGVTYLASAGNRARQSWEGTLNLSGASEDFDPGAGVDTVQTIGTFTNRSPFLSLQWAEPWGHATTDLAIDVYIDGALLGTVDDNDLVSGIPLEIFGVTITGTHTLGIGIRRIGGTGLPQLKYIVGGTPVFTVAEFPTNSNAINPDAASAAGSLAVAASQYTTPTTPEPFSSRGPNITRYFDKDGNKLATPAVRDKPQLDAPDGVSTTLPPGSGLNPFFGTSAATPAAAGVAVLLLAANPALSVDAVRGILTDPRYALDCTPTAGQPDADCGSGFIQADRMIPATHDTTAPTVTSSLAPAPGPKGWFPGNVTATWMLTDADSPVYTQSGCAPTTLTASGTATCTATSVGGTTTKSVSVQIDKSGPTQLKAKGLKKVYKHGTKPDKKKIKCKAKDKESGIVTCKVKGLKTSKGTHTATVIATNGAGLVSTKKFKYTIQ
jgi:hypothetical protein